eukprot:203363-Pyramimonas_sp.AAC.1
MTRAVCRAMPDILRVGAVRYTRAFRGGSLLPDFTALYFCNNNCAKLDTTRLSAESSVTLLPGWPTSDTLSEHTGSTCRCNLLDCRITPQF